MPKHPPKPRTPKASNAPPPRIEAPAASPFTGRRMILSGAAFVVVVAAALALWRPWERPAAAVVAAAVTPPTFVGSQACAGCHANATKAWTGSQHARAMQEANEQTVLGDFADRRFEHRGSSAIFSRRHGKFFVR